MYKKQYGQNFLINSQIAQQIVNLSNIHNENILEIGPGNLALSKFIIKKKPKKYVALEIDKEIYLKSKKFFLSHSHEIININALKFDEINFFNNENFNIISNLPFNISSQLLIKWLKIKSQNNQIKQMVLMFQKELAKRIVSLVNNKYYGRLSVITSAFFKTKIHFTVNKKEFFPIPKVDASIVIFEPLKINQIHYSDFKKLEDITFLFFNSRRKKNKKKIKSLFKEKDIKNFGFDKFFEMRPENIDPETYFKMCLIKN